MRCGRILVEGESEEIAASPKPRSQRKNGKRSNPFSARGLDKFQSVYAELSARKECIAKESGVPEDMVRFAYSRKGWIPVVVRAGEGIGKKNIGKGIAGVSIPRPEENNNGEKDGELMRKGEGNRINGESESISISVLDGRSHSLIMPWSRILTTTAFGVLCLSAISVGRLAVPVAAAMAVGGVMCMRKFILSGVLYSSLLYGNPGNPQSSQNGGGVEATAEKKDIDKLSIITPTPGLTVNATAPSRYLQPIEFLASASPTAVKPKEVHDKHKRHHHNKSKVKIFRVVSMDNQPTRPARPQKSDSFYRRMRLAMTYDACAGATAMIITLFCLAFYGQLCAIIFTSAWWYFRPMFVHHSEKDEQE